MHTLELLAALHRTHALRLRVLVRPDPSPTARAVLDSLDGLEYVNERDVVDGTPATAVVHRPYQVSSAPDLLTLRQVGERLVVTHQDLLGYHNAAYHPDRAHLAATTAGSRVRRCAPRTVWWRSRSTLERDLRAEDLVPRERLRVVHIGVDHRLAALAVDAARAGPRRRRARTCCASAPTCATRTARSRSRLLRELRALGWHGHLVFAGPHVERRFVARMRSGRCSTPTRC